MVGLLLTVSVVYFVIVMLICVGDVLILLGLFDLVVVFK